MRRPECRQILQLTLRQYEDIRANDRHFLNAVGHQVAAQGWGEVVARFEGYVIVEKLGRAGEVVESLADADESAAEAPLPER